MSVGDSFATGWGGLDARFQACLRAAWGSAVSRGLPVGAVVSQADEIVGVGRNRVYDPPGGNDPLQATVIAHAEMNALASIPPETDLAGCELWSTQSPCSMCAAAAALADVVAVHFLASDPSERSGRFVSSGRTDELWAVVANALFLHNVAWVSGTDNPILERNLVHEPEVVALALDLLHGSMLIASAAAGDTVEGALTAIWDRVTESAAIREARLDSTR